MRWNSPKALASYVYYIWAYILHQRAPLYAYMPLAFVYCRGDIANTLGCPLSLAQV